jgi:hypothetical protein
MPVWMPKRIVVGFTCGVVQLPENLDMTWDDGTSNKEPVMDIYAKELSLVCLETIFGVWGHRHARIAALQCVCATSMLSNACVAVTNRTCTLSGMQLVQGWAAAYFAAGCSVFYGVWKAVEYADKPAHQPYVRTLGPLD